MTTERLYYDQSYLTEFDAQVVALREDGWIALDRSAFYPTSGGQPHDTGVLRCGERILRVCDVTAEDQTVWHRVDGALQVGERVRGQIDWPRRWDHMQQHAADHMLAGAAWQMLGAVIIGLHLGRKDSTIDLTLPDGRTRLEAGEKEALETLVNQRVQQDDPIRCWFPSEAEWRALPLRKQPTVRDHVRIVAMGDYEMVPCGGTHPRTTGQIGPVKILSTLPARGKMRLSFVAGMRAIRVFQGAARCAEEVSAALSSDWTDAPDALQRERQIHQAQRKESGERLLRAALQAVHAGKEGHLCAAHLDFADRETLIRAAAEWTKDPQAVALLSCPGEKGRMLVFVRGAEAALDMGALLRQSGARGGGRPDMAQGSAPDGKALEAARQWVLAHQESTGSQA